MVDNIRLERIWQDDDFFELLVTCSNDVITATTHIYVTDIMIDSLENVISDTINQIKTNANWQSSNRGEETTPCVSFKIFPKDSRGHFLIECFMELDDGAKFAEHTCCFYINTEYGLLNSFKSKLKMLKTPIIGTTISLFDESV